MRCILMLILTLVIKTMPVIAQPVSSDSQAVI
jgi:hypothetical protein